jgi:peptidoglycan/LPS O-acetylase OafA/YrhL
MIGIKGLRRQTPILRTKRLLVFVSMALAMLLALAWEGWSPLTEHPKELFPWLPLILRFCLPWVWGTRWWELQIGAIILRKPWTRKR